MHRSNVLITLSTILATTGLTGPTQAQTGYEGADLFGQILAQPLAGDEAAMLGYLGQGSALAEQALIAGTQQTAPMVVGVGDMSRELCETFLGDASQVNIARGNIFMMRTTKSTIDRFDTGEEIGQADLSCDTQLVRDVPNYESDAPNWAEAIQLIYGGAKGQGTEQACLDPARKDLIDNWSSLFEDACDSDFCTSLQYAFRRGDDAGVTKILMELTGIEAFCNGAQHEDNDPLRTDCSVGDENGSDWCPNGTLGVVQAVELPAQAPVDRPACSQGHYEFGLWADSDVCPDLSTPFAGFLCVFPRSCDSAFGCVNGPFNGNPFNPFMDTREYNYLNLNEQLSQRPPLPPGYALAPLMMSRKCRQDLDRGQPISSGAQLACLLHELKCSIGFGANPQMRAQVSNNEVGPQCNTMESVENLALGLREQGEDGAEVSMDFSLSFVSTLPRDASGQLNCNLLRSGAEQRLCGVIGAMVEPDFQDAFAPLGLTRDVNATVTRCEDVHPDLFP